MFQLGFGMEMLPAFKDAVIKRAREHRSEEDAKKVETVVTRLSSEPAWQAMLKLAVPVDNHFKHIV